MGIRPQIQSFLTFQTILFFLAYSRLSWYVNYRKKLVAILNAQSGGCVPQSTCRACAVKILKRWVQKIAGVPPLYSAYSLVRWRRHPTPVFNFRIYSCALHIYSSVVQMACTCVAAMFLASNCTCAV